MEDVLSIASLPFLMCYKSNVINLQGTGTLHKSMYFLSFGYSHMNANIRGISIGDAKGRGSSCPSAQVLVVASLQHKKMSVYSMAHGRCGPFYR